MLGMSSRATAACVMVGILAIGGVIKGVAREIAGVKREKYRSMNRKPDSPKPPVKEPSVSVGDLFKATGEALNDIDEKLEEVAKENAAK